MDVYTLELGEYFSRPTCQCCGMQKNRVWGFVSKNNVAHAVYHALLNIGEEFPRIGLTLSIGPWGEGTEPSPLSWVHIDIRAEAGKIQLVMRDPKDFNFYPWGKSGAPPTSEQASTDSALEEFRSVSNFIVESDVAISSYLSGSDIDTSGRKSQDAANPLRNC